MDGQRGERERLSLQGGAAGSLDLRNLLELVRDGRLGVEDAEERVAVALHAELSRHLSSLCRGVIHDLNNLRAGLFSNLDYLGELMQVWARLHLPLERLVRASALVPELCRYADEIRSLDDEAELAAAVEDTPELLADLAETRLRCQNLVERLDLISNRSKGLLVEEELEQAVGRVVAEVAHGRAALPLLEVRSVAPIHLFTYRQLLERSLAELLQNALDASVGPESVVITLARAGEWVSITVADRGAGMGAEELAQAFLPFHTTRSPESSTGVRRGLGLNVARRAALLMGGDVRLASRPGAGTTATLRLPAPTCAGRRVLLLGELPEGLERALPGAVLVRVRSEADLTTAVVPRPALVLVASGARPATVLALLERLDHGDPAGRPLPPVPVVRYHGRGATSDGRRPEEEALERRFCAEAEDLEFLEHEVRRVLLSQAIDE